MVSASALLFQDYLTETTLQVQTLTRLQYVQWRGLEIRMHCLFITQ